MFASSMIDNIFHLFASRQHSVPDKEICKVYDTCIISKNQSEKRGLLCNTKTAKSVHDADEAHVCRSHGPWFQDPRI